jgi:multidrug efflux pump subunit AcrA (membrane-fusion protein)
MLTQFFVLGGSEHGLTPNERVRVELPKADTGGSRRTIVPYSAVYYDSKGDAWVYLNPKALVFERAPIKVDRVAGDAALLLEGPEPGSAVVTVGAALLYGTEIYGK